VNGDLTWTCHVCGRKRPDARISVLSKPGLLAGRFPYTENVRYCNDDPSCREGAVHVRFIETQKARSTKGENDG
jgi:hypothetical protein